ncbi:hypothetical protein BGW36DRAFT_390067 [Talaromyces proteolyticus]|uniref:Vacuolar import/degradation Vid27 C-terminal domain-containing protein n=1 Tax=Talaromyces proteolyticus TaxID=1131652 RepID=A0AAD4KGQ7_9EURO|nr:uncharacterized protein BGW36DRAFT_390067 [Talaromyces proteolyticus]KAH8690007.1 hypothetical protein BGW36DRAFT_390067 [Talaromyces proteolyticus]
MGALRVPNEGRLKHKYYDDEYVSQGELDIRGKSSTTSLHDLIESGLFKTFPPFILHDKLQETVPSHVRVRNLYKDFQKGDWVYEYPVQHIHWAKNMAYSIFSYQWAQEAALQAFLSLMPQYNQENTEIFSDSHLWKFGRCMVRQISPAPPTETDQKVQSSCVCPSGDWIVATYKTFLLLIKAYPAPLGGNAKTFRLSLHPSHIDMIKDFNKGACIELSNARFTIAENDLFVIARSGRCIVMWEVQSVVEDGTDFCFITHCLDEDTAHKEFEALCS